MKELSPAARNLLLLARNSGAPDAAARARVERALLEQLGTPIAAGTVAGELAAGKLAAGATGKAAYGLTSVAAKALLLVGVAGAVVALGVELSPPSVAPNVSPLAHSAALVESPSSSGFVEAPSPVVEAAPESTTKRVIESRENRRPARIARAAERSLEPRDASGRSEVPPAVRDPSPVGFPLERTERDAVDQPERTDEKTGRERDVLPSPPGKSPTPRGDTTDQLGAEAQGLREIQRALRDGNGQTALELVAGDSTRFSRGVLQQERAAAKIQALCLLGRADAARAEAESFEQRWPRSPLLARVRSACR
jgi:hypothetical protein